MDVKVEVGNISCKNVIAILPNPTLQPDYLDEMRKGTTILCLCKITHTYWDGTIKKISGVGSDKTFVIHFPNFGKKHEQMFTFSEALISFLPRTNETREFQKKHKEEKVSLVKQYSLQERVYLLEDEEDDDDGENNNAVGEKRRSSPQINPEFCQTIETLYNRAQRKVQTIYPPRRNISEILHEFNGHTNIIKCFNDFTLNSFCSDFETKYMFSTNSYDSDKENKHALDRYVELCKIRGLNSITLEEIRVKDHLLGTWKPEFPLRFYYGVTHLIRFMRYIYQSYYAQEYHTRLTEQQTETIAFISELANFIDQNRDKYFCEGKDFILPNVEKRVSFGERVATIGPEDDDEEDSMDYEEGDNGSTIAHAEDEEVEML